MKTIRYFFRRFQYFIFELYLTQKQKIYAYMKQKIKKVQFQMYKILL